MLPSFTAARGTHVSLHGQEVTLLSVRFPNQRSSLLRLHRKQKMNVRLERVLPLLNQGRGALDISACLWGISARLRPQIRMASGAGPGNAPGEREPSQRQASLTPRAE